jgi:histidine triad (HIT) family protein
MATPTLFTRILRRELPGRFVYEDDVCAVFLSIHPLRPGHVLVVPRAEVDHVIDLSDADYDAVCRVGRTVGRALHRAYGSTKVGMMFAGLEVPHVHLHVVPIDSTGDLEFRRANTAATAEELDAALVKVREALRALGPDVAAHVPAEPSS